jgi:hypothetical protein
MFNADDGQVGSSAPQPAPLDQPVQAPAAGTQSPQPITINININVSISINLPETAPSPTPAPPAAVPPTLPVGTPAAPSTGPGDGFTTLMNPPESWRDISYPKGITLGTISDYLKWLGKIYVAGAPPVGEFDMRDTVWPTEPPAQSPSRPRTPPPSVPFFGPNPHHPKGVGGPWQH